MQRASTASPHQPKAASELIIINYHILLLIYLLVLLLNVYHCNIYGRWDPMTVHSRTMSGKCRCSPGGSEAWEQAAGQRRFEAHVASRGETPCNVRRASADAAQGGDCASAPARAGVNKSLQLSGKLP